MSEASNGRPWTDEDQFRAAFIDQGKSTTELAEQWGCSRQTIYRWRERHGFDQHDGKPWSDEATLRKVLVDEGRSPYDLADEWDCYAQTIYTWVNKFDIDIPGRESPFKDEAFARREYVEKGKSLEELGEEHGYTAGAVKYWLKKHGIGRRKSNKEKPPNLRTGKQGYVRVRSNDKSTTIHRLVAVAEWGFDAVCGNVVHHINEIPWDNRAENLDVMARPKHNHLHLGTTHGDGLWRNEEWLRNQYWEEGKTLVEIASECGVSDVTVHRWMVRLGIDRR